MLAYYNEIDPYAAQWLRNLIAAGHITPGEVDTRSIVDVRPDDLVGFERCHFFAGVGVWDYALNLAGWPTGRQVWTGSCPCQPFSAAGKRGGTADERHLWPAFFHLIEQRGPATILGEQVASKDGLDWLDLVHADLEGAGYDVGATDLCAAGVGAPHRRQRLWFVADTIGKRWEWRQGVSSRGDVVRPNAGWLQGSDGPIGVHEIGRGAMAEPAGVGLSSGARESGVRSWPEQSERSSSLGVLGHSGGSGSRRHTRTIPGPQGEGPGERRRDGSEPDQPINAGAACDMGHASGSGLSTRERQDLRREGRRQEGRAAEQSGGASSRLANTDQGGRDALPSVGFRDTEHHPQSRGHNGGPSLTFWSECDWIPCRDGKARPVEPGSFPLAHGAPARVGRLRAYGNAICAEAAVAFIQAVMDVRP